MPRRKGSGGSGPGVGHNSGTVHTKAERDALIQRACKEITDLEAEKKAIGEKISAVKSELVKGKLGMKIKNFNVSLQLYQADDEARDEMLSAIAETFEALGVDVGETLDWVKAGDRLKVKRQDNEAGQADAAKSGPVGQAPGA